MINNKTLELLKLHEGLRLNAYKDPTGTPTIGYGNTFYEDGTKVKLSDKPITKERAEKLLLQTVSIFEKNVLESVNVGLTPNQLGALTMFSYNVGVGAFKDSTLLKKINSNPTDPQIESEFQKWIFSKGVKLNGLVKRRNDEYTLYKSTSVFTIGPYAYLLLPFFFLLYFLTNKNKKLWA